METKLRVILFVKLLAMLIIILLITACSPSEYEIEVEVEVDSVDIVSLTFEYKPSTLLEGSKDIVYIETEEQTYVINFSYYEEVEFVKSDESTFTEKHKIRKVLDTFIRDKYATIELGPELIKSASSEYAKTRKKTLDLKESSEIDI